MRGEEEKFDILDFITKFKFETLLIDLYPLRP